MADNFGEGLLEGLQGAQSLQTGKLQQQGLALHNEQETLALQQAKMMMQIQGQVAKKMASMNQGASGTESLQEQSERVAKSLYTAADTYANYGMTEQAGKYAEIAATVSKNTNDLLIRQHTEEREKWAEIGSLASTATDPQSWSAALQQYQLAHPKEPLPQWLTSMPYSPQAVERIKAISQTQQQQAETNLAKARMGEVEQQTKTSKAQADLDVARTEQARASAERLRGEGKEPKAPTSQQLQAITDLAASEYPGADPAQLRARSRAAAEDAVKIFQDNPDKGWDFAARTAYSAAKAEGKYAGIKPSTQRAGASPQKPMTVEKDSNGKVDPSSFRENMWYRDKDFFGDDEPRWILNGVPYTQAELDDQPAVESNP